MMQTPGPNFCLGHMEIKRNMKLPTYVLAKYAYLSQIWILDGILLFHIYSQMLEAKHDII